MRLQLHNITIDLKSDSALICQQWQELFRGWLIDDSAQVEADFCLHLQEVPTLPPLPEGSPFFDDQEMWPDSPGVLSAYHRDDNHVLLHFHAGALIDVPLPPPSPTRQKSTSPLHAHGFLSGLALRRELLEDITYTSLAPLLRRKGYYLLHAFAAARNGRCLLIVGPSKSGKTTTGLNLILNGWQLLSNDAVLLEARSDGIYALSTPGDVGIRPKSFALLPQLSEWLPADHAPNSPFNITGQQFVNGRWSAPMQVHAIITPQIENITASYVQPQARALCFAHLMRESVDRWDELAIDQHINFLQQLSKQVLPYNLHLGSDVENIPELLRNCFTNSSRLGQTLSPNEWQ